MAPALLAGLILAAIAAASPTPEAIVAHARRLPVHSIDGSLPTQERLDAWLRGRARGATLAWEANDCGERTGDPGMPPIDFPVCAEATFVNCRGEKSTLSIAVGTAQGGLGRGTAAIFWAATGKSSADTLARFAALNPRCEAAR